MWILRMRKQYISIKVIIEIEGTLKEHFYTRGEYRDCYVMGLLKGIGLIRMMMICLI